MRWFFADSAIGKTISSHHFGRFFLELFPRTLSKSKKKGWDDGERQMGCVVVFFFVWEVSNIDVWSTRHPVTVTTGQDYYIFSRESLCTFICNTYWVGSRSNIHYFYHYLGKMNRFWLIYSKWVETTTDLTVQKLSIMYTESYKKICCVVNSVHLM